MTAGTKALDAEFAEKTYEKYFSNELSQLAEFSFSPDQLDEEFFGFDEAFFLSGRHAVFPYVRFGRRHRRTGISLKGLENLSERAIRHAPDFRFNLLVQYKRPAFISSPRGTEWSCWNRPYYRYETMDHQQTALKGVEHQSRGRASVVYASPAFWEKTQLFQYARDRAVVENSNIAAASRLATHHRYTYITRGGQGKGHSEPIELSSPSIKEILQVGMEQEALPLRRHLKNAVSMMKEIASSDPITDRAFHLALEAHPFSEATPDGALHSFVVIDAFESVFDVTHFSFG